MPLRSMFNGDGKTNQVFPYFPCFSASGRFFDIYFSNVRNRVQYGLYVHQWRSKCRRTKKEDLNIKALNSLIEDIAVHVVTKLLHAHHLQGMVSVQHLERIVSGFFVGIDPQHVEGRLQDALNAGSADFLLAAWSLRTMFSKSLGI